jgi:hypothetical protein
VRKLCSCLILSRPKLIPDSTRDHPPEMSHLKSTPKENESSLTWPIPVCWIYPH